MKRDTSCGAVIIQEQSGLRRYRVRHSTQGHWTLCKGHVEGDETEHETAVREIMEETGLTVEFIDGFRQVIAYSPRPACVKDVVFFLGRLSGGTLACQPEEVAEAVLLPFGEAMARLTHPSDQDVLAAADVFLNGR